MGTKYRLLVVDDNKQILKLLESRLTANGYDVVKAENGLGAIDIVTNDRIDLIIMDWKMPFGTGDSVMEFLHSKGIPQKVPIIIMTGLKDPWIDESARSLGAKIVMRKPFDAKDLLKKIEEYLEVSK